MSGNITISAGATTIGFLPSSGTQVNFSTALYKYANLTLPYNPNDPGLQYTYDNVSLTPSVLLYASFFNLLNEPSTPVVFNAGTTFLSPPPTQVECLDVRLFGAVGDGVTDDTAAVQAALDQAHQNWLALQAISPTTDVSIVISGGILGPTIVCIPTGVYCLVTPRWDDQRDRSGAPYANCAINALGQPFYPSAIGSVGAVGVGPMRIGTAQNNPNAPSMVIGQSNFGLAALLIDDGVTLQIDGGLILGRSTEVMSQLGMSADQFMYKNFYSRVYAIQNKNCFIQGPFASTPVSLPNSPIPISRPYQEFVSGSLRQKPQEDAFTGDGTTVTFTLSQDPTASSVSTSTNIDFIITSSEITFSSPPPVGLFTVDYTFSDPGFELGPRNINITITGEGFIDCGADYWMTYPTVDLPCYVASSGIGFCKCDQSEVNNIKIKAFMGMGIYWGHSDSAVIQNCEFLDGRDTVTGANYGIFCAVTLDVLRKSIFFQNYMHDMTTGAAQVGMCTSLAFTHNKIQRSGSIANDGIFVDPASEMFGWTINEDFNADLQMSMNELTFNRGKAWAPNQLYEGDAGYTAVIYPTAGYTNPISPGPLGYWDWYNQWPAGNDNNLSGYVGGGFAGATEPAWNNALPAPIDEPVFQVVGELLGFGGGLNSSDLDIVAFVTFFGAPNDTSQLKVYLDGVLQEQGPDYLVSGGIIFFAVAPVSGQIITADYPANLTWNERNEISAEGGPSFLTVLVQIGGGFAGVDNTPYLTHGIKYEHNIMTDNDSSGNFGFLLMADSSISYNDIERNADGISEDVDCVSFIHSLGPPFPLSKGTQILQNIVTFYPNYLGGSVTEAIHVCSADTGLTVDNPQVDPTTITRAGASQNFYNQVPGEVPGGIIDGANTIFTLANAPIVSTLQLYVNGLLEDTTNYTLVGNMITFNTAPSMGSTLSATYEWM